MKLLDFRVWLLIECDCGNQINISEFLLKNHCEKCGKVYRCKLYDSIVEVKEESISEQISELAKEE